MMFKNSFLKQLLFVVILLSFFTSCRVKLEPVRILTFQEKLSELFVNTQVFKLKDSINNFTVYNFEVDQFQNKLNKELGVFKQQFKLYHTDENLPVVVEFVNDFDENVKFNFNKLFEANYLYIKTREEDAGVYNNQNISNDYHSIISQLKRVYTNKWISYGNFNSANNALIHRSFYPWDVEVSVVLQPNIINLPNETIDFLENRGKKILYFISEEKANIQIKPHVDAVIILTNNSDEFMGDIQKNNSLQKFQKWLGYSVNFNN